MDKMLSLSPVSMPNVRSIVRLTYSIPPIERVRLFSDEQFEDFISEWAVLCLKPSEGEVYNLGGAGDKGRDIIVEFGNGRTHYYQCKKYDKALTPSQIYVELGKLCYFTYAREIRIPEKYYFVCPHDVGPSLKKLLENPTELKDKLLEQWNNKCEKEITEKRDIPLDVNLKQYIENFDFSIFGCRGIHSIIEEYSHHETFFFLRFGSPVPPQRPTPMNPPTDIRPIEENYVNKAIRAYTLSKGIKLDSDKDMPSDGLGRFLSTQRKIFYIAESLRQYSRRIYLDDEPFEELKDEVYSAVEDTVLLDYKDPLTRLHTTLAVAANANTSISPLDNQFKAVKNDDRRGICHHLANEDRIDWEASDE